MKDAEWIDLLESIQVDKQVAVDFVAMRKAKKAPLSQTALKMIQTESMKAGMTMQDALAECVLRGWTGFKAEWVKTQTQQESKPLYPVWHAEPVKGHADAESRKRVLDALPPVFRRH